MYSSKSALTNSKQVEIHYNCSWAERFDWACISFLLHLNNDWIIVQRQPLLHWGLFPHCVRQQLQSILPSVSSLEKANWRRTQIQPVTTYSSNLNNGLVTLEVPNIAACMPRPWMQIRSKLKKKDKSSWDTERMGRHSNRFIVTDIK